MVCDLAITNLLGRLIVVVVLLIQYAVVHSAFNIYVEISNKKNILGKKQDRHFSAFGIGGCIFGLENFASNTRPVDDLVGYRISTDSYLS